MIKLNRLKAILIFSFLFLLSFVLLIDKYLFTTQEEVIQELFVQNSDIIKKYCSIYHLEPRKYISIVYGELINNYNEFDKFDSLRAVLGFDSSVGYAQLKVSTASWLEKNYNLQLRIFPSKNRDELIRRICNIEWNIKYSVFYIGLIEKEYKKIFSERIDVNTLGAHYGRGIDYGKEIVQKLYNNIGKSAKSFYYSDMLLHEFPKAL